MKKFGEILKDSWKEYKENFAIFLIIFLIFYALPYILISFMKAPDFNVIFTQGISTSDIYFFIASIVSAIICSFMTCSLIYNSLYKKKRMGFKETLLGGKKYFLKYILFFIVHGIFLALSYLFFIIPGIAFHVFWIFSAYILIGENSKIIESLKKSYRLIKGKWWRTFGLSLLFILTVVGIMILSVIAGGLVNIIIMLPFIIKMGLSNFLQSASGIPNYILTITNVLSNIFTLGAKLITLPLGVLFFKNFYQDYKNKK